jgi:hypothetical protein
MESSTMIVSSGSNSSPSTISFSEAEVVPAAGVSGIRDGIEEVGRAFSLIIAPLSSAAVCSCRRRDVFRSEVLLFDIGVAFEWGNCGESFTDDARVRRG